MILDLEVNKDSRGALTAAGPAINTKQVKTQVLVENGGTVVLGGIFTQDERTEINKVPLLGDIPLPGAAVSEPGAQHQQDRTADLHHAEGRHRPHDCSLTEHKTYCYGRSPWHPEERFK